MLSKSLVSKYVCHRVVIAAAVVSLLAGAGGRAGAGRRRRIRILAT